MSETQEWFMYRNPAEVLERKEIQTCKGCKYIDSAWDKPFCNRVKDNPRPADKCTLYTEAE